jgi:hypothetical protein
MQPGWQYRRAAERTLLDLVRHGFIGKGDRLDMAGEVLGDSFARRYGVGLVRSGKHPSLAAATVFAWLAAKTKGMARFNWTLAVHFALQDAGISDETALQRLLDAEREAATAHPFETELNIARRRWTLAE